MADQFQKTECSSSSPEEPPRPLSAEKDTPSSTFPSPLPEGTLSPEEELASLEGAISSLTDENAALRSRLVRLEDLAHTLAAVSDNLRTMQEQEREALQREIQGLTAAASSGWAPHLGMVFAVVAMAMAMLLLTGHGPPSLGGAREN
eukprot:RCo048261